MRILDAAELQRASGAWHWPFPITLPPIAPPSGAPHAPVGPPTPAPYPWVPLMPLGH